MRIPLLSVACLSIVAVLPSFAAAPATLRNSEYEMAVHPDGIVELTSGGAAAQRFEPHFVVLTATDDPAIAMRPGGVLRVNYNVPTWQAPKGVKAKLGGPEIDTKVVAGDGFDDNILKGDREGRTANLFQAGKAVEVSGTAASVEGRSVRWQFPKHEGYSFAATITLPDGSEPPKLEFEFSPTKTGWYSVGYVGAPAVDSAELSELWQPLIWTEQRFPHDSILTLAFQCPVPATLVTNGGITTGVVAAPAEFPFQPLPRFENSRFGVALHNREGKAQPMLFAPALGGPGSSMFSEEKFRFSMYLLVRNATCSQTFEHVAKTLYAFRDHRTNGECSLNQTIENEIEYGLSSYSRFNDDLRGCAYDTDVAGSVKNVSALHPLAMGLVTDDERIYQSRTRPIIEFLLSREKLLFINDPNVKTQNPGRLMTGPCAPVSELAMLYLVGQRRTPLLLDYAERLSAGKPAVKPINNGWNDCLALYRATGDKKQLEKAVAAADAYLVARVAQKQTVFQPAFFWTAFPPDWIALYELFEETGEKRFLDVAAAGAREFAQFVWFSPVIPKGEVKVNEGGKAPVYYYLAKRTDGPMSVPEESVPAWQLSEIGLTCESAGTAVGHRAIFMANHAAWMLRIAQHTGDKFLHDIARSAIVGRSCNFPGYHMNTARTTVYQKADYPLHEYKQLSYNSFHFNHIWPHIALLTDYLVSDAAYRSKGEIDFPSRYAEGYGYLQSKIYGDRPGHIYGEKDAWLWMPKGLVQTGNAQVNYIAARSANSLYLVLTNESFEPVETTLQVNREMVNLANAKAVRVWKENSPSEPVSIEAGKVPVRIAAQGITVLAIDSVNIEPRFQKRVLAEGQSLGPQSFVKLDYAGTTGMLLSMGAGLTNAYVYLQATDDRLQKAALYYRTNAGAWKSATDEKYPFEFTVATAAGDDAFEFYVEGTGKDGSVEHSALANLRR